MGVFNSLASVIQNFTYFVRKKRLRSEKRSFGAAANSFNAEELPGDLEGYLCKLTA